jgi:hypothetical protein
MKKVFLAVFLLTLAPQSSYAIDKTAFNADECGVSVSDAAGNVMETRNCNAFVYAPDNGNGLVVFSFVLLRNPGETTPFTGFVFGPNEEQKLIITDQTSKLPDAWNRETVGKVKCNQSTIGSRERVDCSFFDSDGNHNVKAFAISR